MESRPPRLLPALPPTPETPEPIVAPNIGRRALLPVTEVLDRVRADDDGKWDTQVLRTGLHLRDNRIEFDLKRGRDGLANAGSYPERLALSGFAFGQICMRLGIPAHYLKQCPPRLREENLNHWLKQGPPKPVSRDVGPERPFDGDVEDGEAGETEIIEPSPPPTSRKGRRPEHEIWTLRVKNDKVRAALSDSYSPLDNTALVDALVRVLPLSFRAEWLALDETSFHLRLIDPSRARTVLPGDDYFVGIHIANSEVGARAVTIDAVAYRLVCTNGMIALVKGKSLLRRRHIHLEPSRFGNEVQGAMREALQASDNLLAQLRTAASNRLPEPDTVIRRLSKLWGQSDETANLAVSWLNHEPANIRDSAYGVVQAFTHVARYLPGDSRYDLEVLAGNLAQHGVPSFATVRDEKPALPNGRIVTAGGSL